jgi:hypothetical protein
MHLWAPYITRTTCCWANSKISFISVSCKISTEKWRPRVVLVFCSRFFYALSNDWNSTQHWFVSKVVGLHHWIGWWLKFFVWRVLQSGWQRPNWTMAQDFLSDSGRLPCPFVTAIHAGKWDADSGILSCLITRWNPHSWGCLKGDSDSTITSCLIKRYNPVLGGGV